MKKDILIVIVCPALLFHIPKLTEKPNQTRRGLGTMMVVELKLT
jgi:hypothetical protein